MSGIKYKYLYLYLEIATCSASYICGKALTPITDSSILSLLKQTWVWRPPQLHLGASAVAQDLHLDAGLTLSVTPVLRCLW